MTKRRGTPRNLLNKYASALLSGPPGLTFMPALCLVAFWLGGEQALMAVAAITPFVYLLSGQINLPLRVPRAAVTGVFKRNVFEDLLGATYAKATETGRQSATFMIAIDDFDQLVTRYGQYAADLVVERTGERLVSALRGGDHVGKLEAAKFAICMAPVRHLNLETCIQMAGRLQAVIEEPIPIDGVNVYVTAPIGFCQHARAPGRNSADWLEGANIALLEAQARGSSAIRAFSEQMRRDTKTRAALCDEVGHALDSGQIQPWFQPQISSDTGEITGFEALARWSHPVRGMISPAEFLPAIEKAGLLERLAEVMMYHSFAALKAWDGADISIPQIGVNFAGPELSNPHLVEKIKWELDRFDLQPERLVVEVLETVVASTPDDMITRNIKALGDMGCGIDLDDFGTGHASIASIRRFAVSRIKIDRSFIMKADRDPEQQQMIGAILTMAERLGVETLGEGVETVGEHVLLAQLGCDHVQGYGIARPMPFEKTLDWVSHHSAKLQNLPTVMDGRTN